MIVLVGNIWKLEKNFLPHFLNHYRTWGVDKFFLEIYGGERNPAWEEIKRTGNGNYIKLCEAKDEEWSIDTDHAFKNRIRALINPEDWLIPVDIDEFHTVPGYNNFKEVQKDCEAVQAECVFSNLIDRIAENGDVTQELLPDIPVLEQFPVEKNVLKDITKGYGKKVCFQKPNVYINIGHHDVNLWKTYKVFDKVGKSYHIKWFGKTFYDRENAKADLLKKQNKPWINENIRLFNYLKSTDGKL